ncbi:uncharacterized protein LOC126672536 [Mercurialis annua]|uniref:uncharacterized protein LOC126672536 n=1 Tax=Mercurialis annua TaxID=3986 RepID=UPI0024AD208A|nr:uncharacterized protein LOC126672536 [Mercurialis annua]
MTRTKLDNTINLNESINTERLHDSGMVSRGLLDIFRFSWFAEGSTWKKLKAGQKTFYWEEFKKKFFWDSIYPEQLIRDVFMRHAVNRYKDTLHALKGKRDDSVNDTVWDAWQAEWATVEGQELGRIPTYTKLYVRMHSTQKDQTKFVDKRSKDKPGVKKQRVYGVGSAAASYIASSQTSHSRGGSSSSQQTQTPEEIGERIQTEVEARVHGMEERVRGQVQRDIEATVDDQIADRVRSELAKMMNSLPPGFCPLQPPRGPDDEDINRFGLPESPSGALPMVVLCLSSTIVKPPPDQGVAAISASYHLAPSMGKKVRKFPPFYFTGGQ